MYTTYTAAVAYIHMDASCILRTQQQHQLGYIWIHHGYYIHISSSMDTHGYIMDTTYIAAAWMHMDPSWIVHTQQQQHGYTWIHHGYCIHTSNIMDTHD
jgi:hypothetical protein